jgi:membrane-associated phospholipid phosphatase
VRALAVLYPCLTTVAVLATGNHFVLDVLAGLLTFAVSVALVQLCERRLTWRARRLTWRARRPLAPS